ncbi:uncharacterized protein [Cicer arietinum]|uniref:Uncharacterized protein LOC101500991 isoform X2 n=1 Tax=Cicer arietinum TaxID=3827 RepID=A0A3Q7YBF9_CICAR|nr:uncharacterized protein LOC101500991 isoform X2 [Cicer arietinum]
MDCNKEEALRAKGIAEKKMESKDFAGARTFVLKARKLYPDLENIAQMLVVCDVHCFAEQKLLEAAFKLIGEAQRVLLDRDKRSSLDMNLSRFSMIRTAMPSHHQRNVQVNFNPVMQTNVRPIFTNLNLQQQHQSRQPTQQGINVGASSFWTMCSFCKVRYEYPRAYLNRSLRCQQCGKPFIAYEVDLQSTKPATNPSQQVFGQQNSIPNDGAFKVGVGSQGNLHAQRSNTKSDHKKGSTSNVSEKSNGKRRRKQVVESSESSESIGSTDSEDDTFSDNNVFPGVSTYREECPRRSTRRKHQVSYNENVSDEDNEPLQPLKQGQGSGSPYSDGENNGEETEMKDQNGEAAGLKDDQKEVKRKQNFYSEESSVNIDMKIKEVRGTETGGSSDTDEPLEHSASKSTNYLDGLVYPDPEFSDFDKDKKEECFASGQVWAVYDDIDGMPRFYAIIKTVSSPGFKLRIAWFEPDPDDKDERKWVDEKLPSACGKYKLGKTITTEDHLMFSHVTCFEKISRSTFKVYPRKGETWALFKNWDIKWYMDAESHEKYDLEFVEILSDYVEGAGVIVAYLAKLKGFVSLFSRTMKGSNCSFRIPPVELFRFSHRVPSYKMTGQERTGVPVGSYELDPVSLPVNLEEIVSPSVGMSPRSSDMSKFTKGLDGDASTVKVNLDRSKSVEEKKDPVGHIDDVGAPSASVKDSFEVPDPMFYQFDAERSHEKFEVGQIWAFYGDSDGLPKYYGQIKGVKRTSPEIELQVIYLTSCWLPRKVDRWDDVGMIISCGRFKIKESAKACTYRNTCSVSHQVHTRTAGKNKEYEIFPRKGEIWALYRDWTHKIKRSDLPNCEYDIVEVVEVSDGWIDVLYLEKVSGYSSVFKGKLNNKRLTTITISRTELLKFSHKIPAFKLTEEHDNLRGFWELDPRAIPHHYFIGYKK